MTREDIETLSQQTGLSFELVEYISKKTGTYMKEHLSTTTISRFLFKRLGTFRLRLVYINRIIRHYSLPYLRYVKNNKDSDVYEKQKERFRYLWNLRQSAIHYDKTKNKYNGINKRKK